MEWIITCDQPFDDDELCAPWWQSFEIPQCNTTKQRVVKMGEDTIEGVHEMFLVCYSPLNTFL
jgi:hypothetical protein